MDLSRRGGGIYVNNISSQNVQEGKYGWGGPEKVGKLFKVDDAMAHNHRVAHHTLSLVGQPKQNMSINFSNT